MEPESKTGQCPRCLAIDNDETEKKLYRCFLCGGFFCRKHIRPKPCYIVDLGQPHKNPTKRRYLNDDDYGHPDADSRYDDYLINIPPEGEGEKPIEETELPQPPVSIPIEAEGKRTVEFGTCPRCKRTNSHIIKNYPHKAILKCWNCHLKYGQRKYSPYHYIRLRRRKLYPRRPQRTRQQPIIRSPDRPQVPRIFSQKTKKPAKNAAIAGAIIVILLAIIFFSGALDYFGSENLTPSSTFSPVPSSVFSPLASPVSSPGTQQNLLVNPKIMHYNYTLRGVSSELSFTVYGGMYDYLASHEDSTVHSSFGKQPSSDEVYRIVTLRYINESIEQAELQNLANKIKQLTPNEDDQARIAISLVQNIPYDWNSFQTNNVQSKYPYEVLYSNTGVCGQKSMLLVCLLRDLGYGCSILEFTSQNHAAVGIACPHQYAYYSGYAFVESTTPTIITDCYGDYIGAGKLPSSPSYVIAIQDGKIMASVSEEYQDYQTYQSLINMGSVLDESHYNQWQSLVSKYGLHVS